MTAAFMRGAEPFDIAGGDAGIVLLHGFSGSVSEIRELGLALGDAGYGIVAPSLPGHGTTPEELMHVCRDDFFAAAETAYQQVRQRYARVYAVGLSLGGTLALHLAAHFPFEGLVTIAAPVFMSPFVSWTVPLAVRWVPRKSVISNYAAWRGEVVGYRCTPLASLGVLMDVLASVRHELSRVTAPLLILHSTGDKTVPAANAAYIAERVGSLQKAIRVYPNGRHLLTLPPYLAMIQADIVRFLHACEAPYVTSYRPPNAGPR